MTSRIGQLRDLYSTLSSILPEALLEADLQAKLDFGRSTFAAIFEEDQNGLRKLITSKKKQNHIQLDKIREWNYLLAKGLPLLNKYKLEDEHELARYLLCHWFMAANALRVIFEATIDTLRTYREQYNITVHQIQTPQMKKRELLFLDIYKVIRI